MAELKYTTGYFNPCNLRLYESLVSLNLRETISLGLDTTQSPNCCVILTKLKDEHKWEISAITFGYIDSFVIDGYFSKSTQVEKMKVFTLFEGRFSGLIEIERKENV